jgi:hypothetical protein
MAKLPDDDRHFTHGSGGAMADATADVAPRREDHDPTSPHARPVRALRKAEKPDQLADKLAASENRDEARLDEGIEESFPASDPVSAHHIT